MRWRRSTTTPSSCDAQARAQRRGARPTSSSTRKSYHEGNVGVLQVLDAERLYQQARLGYVRAKAQRYLDTAQLFLALGGSAPRASDESGAAGAARRTR